MANTMVQEVWEAHKECSNYMSENTPEDPDFEDTRAMEKKIDEVLVPVCEKYDLDTKTIWNFLTALEAEESFNY